MSLFKKASSETELQAGMQAAQDQMANDEANSDNKKFHSAVELLQEAAQHFADASMDEEATAASNVLLDALEKNGQRKPQEEWTPPWKQQNIKPPPTRSGLGGNAPERAPAPKPVSEKKETGPLFKSPSPPPPLSADEPEAVPEKAERVAPKREELIGSALDLLAKMREQQEYVPTILYLRSVLRKKPRPGVFAKFDVEGPRTGAAFLAGLDREVLVSVLKSHFKEFNVNVKEVDQIANRLDPDEPSSEDKEKSKERKEEAFQSKMKNQRLMQDQEFAPSPVRRIDPMTGEITEVPVEFRHDVRRPRFMMQTPKKQELSDEEKEALREERKRERLRERQLPYATRPNLQQTRQELEQARLEDESRREQLDMTRQQQSAERLRMQEEEEAKRQSERAELFNAPSSDWLNEAKVRLDVLEKSAIVNYQSAINIMQSGLDPLTAKKKKKKDTSSKNPGKSQDEKKVWRMYGYDGAKNSDKQSADDDDESFED